MFLVANGRALPKSTKAADSDVGDTDVKRSCRKILAYAEEVIQMGCVSNGV